jgi:CRISPR-associated protein Cas2
MLEVKAGVFVGTLSTRIRDELWKHAVAGCKDGSCLQLWSVPSEQGFAFRAVGEPSYHPVDFEGLLLMQRPTKEGFQNTKNPQTA